MKFANCVGFFEAQFVAQSATNKQTKKLTLFLDFIFSILP